MALIDRPCPVCNSVSNSLLYTCKDYSVSQELFNLVSCASCTMVYTNPIPDEASIGKYYKTQEYISHSNTSKGLINKIYQFVRTYTLKGKANLIERVNQNKVGSLLDVGCGTGHFIQFSKIKGWKVNGTEPDEDANTIARSITNQSIYKSILDIPKHEKFDIITLWHVLEHIHQLNQSIEILKSLLTATGTLIIAVPNHESLDAKIYKEKWAAFDVPRHLYHFSKKTIKDLMSRHEFQMVQILPMPFDSFYVSLMTEKNTKTHPSIGLIKAFLNGLRSNFSGKINHSSLIYIFKHANNNSIKEEVY